MGISSSASFSNRVNYTVTDSYGNNSTTESNNRSISTSYTHGTGIKQINNGVSISGSLTAGANRRFDLYNDGSGVLQSSFGVINGVPLNRIKHISVFNLETTVGSHFDVVSTGTSQINLFNTNIDSSGAVRVRPYSSFTFNDPYTGLSIENETKYIYLNDSSGSGCNYSMLILGVDETQPTGTTGQSGDGPYDDMAP
jgi:hypothetical protein